MGEVAGKGGSGVNEYSFKITPHSGTNLFRVKQVTHPRKPRYSRAVIYEASVAETKWIMRMTADLIMGSRSLYEVYDSHGNIVLKGDSTVIPVANLSKGTYYVNFDNQTDKFVKQ